MEAMAWGRSRGEGGRGVRGGGGCGMRCGGCGMRGGVQEPGGAPFMCSSCAICVIGDHTCGANPAAGIQQGCMGAISGESPRMCVCSGSAVRVCALARQVFQGGLPEGAWRP